MNRFYVFLIVAVLVAAAAGVGYYYGQQPVLAPTQENSDTPLVGADRDAHGCIGSAGYSWCEPQQKCLRSWEEPCFASATEEMQYQFAEKYDKPLADITVSITKQTDQFMSGSVKFTAANLPPLGEGGIFLAIKEGNSWKLVHDGNGMVPCEQLEEQYDISRDILQGYCY